jgi:hypothetical protein
MPRDGAITLTDLQAPFLHLVCEPCGRRGRYAVARLIAERGDAKLTDLLQALADCSTTSNSAASIYDRCKAGFGPTIPRYLFCCQTNDDVAIALARLAKRPEPVDDRTIEPDFDLSVRAYGCRGLIDPGRGRLEGFVRLLSDWDLDHVGQT